MLLRYVKHVAARTTTEELGEALAPSLGDKGREVAMTLAERLIEEGEKSGKALGWQEGRQEALRDAALRMLARGFSVCEISEFLGATPHEVQAATDATAKA